MSNKKVTLDEVVAQVQKGSNKRSIQLGFIDNISIVLSKFYQGKGSFYDDYVPHALYTNLFDKLQEDTINIHLEETAIYNIYNVLGATPRKTSREVQNNFMFYDEDIIGPLLDPKLFYLQALYSMVHFINASVYLYQKLALIGREEMQGAMLKFLIVAASNAYEELYSSRGKIEFAYYFKKAIQKNSSIDIEITEFNNKSWKSEFAKLTKSAKTDIDEILGDKEHTQTIYIANLCLTIGKLSDKRIDLDEKRCTIEVGIADMEKDRYDRIFISTIKE